MPDRLLGLDPADFGTTGLTLGLLVGVAFNEPERVLERGRTYGRRGGAEPVQSWRLRAVQELLRRHDVDLDRSLVASTCLACPASCPSCTGDGSDCECYEHQNQHPDYQPEPEPVRQAHPIDPRPGDVWHDAVHSYTGGQYWHARDDGNGGVELYEKNGPGLVRSNAVHQMRGGMTLVHREQEGAEITDAG